MNNFKMTQLAVALIAGMGLVGCTADSGSSSGNGGTGSNTGPGSQSAACLAANPGVVDSVSCTLNTLTDQTAVAPLATLINNLTDPTTGSLSAITGALNSLTQVSGGPLGPLTQLVDGLVASPNSAALAPLISALNTALAALGGCSANPATCSTAVTSLAGQLSNLLPSSAGSTTGLGSLTGLLNGLTPGGAGTATNGGLVTALQTTVANLTGGTAVTAPVNALVQQLISPTTGGLAPLTSVIENATTPGQNLASLTTLVDALTASNNAALAPLITALNSVLGGTSTGQTPTQIATGLLALFSGATAGATATSPLSTIPVLGPLLTGLLGAL